MLFGDTTIQYWNEASKKDTVEFFDALIPGCGLLSLDEKRGLVKRTR